VNRRRIIYLVIGVVGALIALVWVGSQDDRYRAQAVLAIGPASTIVADADLIDILGSIDRSGMPATVSGIATSQSVRDRVAASLGVEAGRLGEYEVDSLPVPSANLLDITVTGPEPQVVAAVANQISEEVRAEFGRIYRVYEITVLTEAREPSNSSRPNGFLVVLGGFVLGAAVAALLDVALAARRRAKLYDAT
jgi:capsular polysaccharide biosynthesis protein